VFRFSAELWRHEGTASWHILTLPPEVADELGGRADAGGLRQGFGSVKVKVTIGSSTWSTSVFPDAKRGTFVLPVKKPVRQAEGIEAGDRVKVALDFG
jgi:hypothetical protein